MSKHFRNLLIALTLGFAIAGQANATTTALGDLSAYTPAFFSQKSFASSAGINDTFTFTLPSPGSFTSILSSIQFFSTNIMGLTLKLSGPDINATFLAQPGNFINTGLLALGGGQGLYSANILGTAGPSGGVYQIQMAAQLAPVPEPSGWMMLLAGFALVGFMVKRRTDLI